MSWSRYSSRKQELAVEGCKRLQMRSGLKEKRFTPESREIKYPSLNPLVTPLTHGELTWRSAVLFGNSPRPGVARALLVQGRKNTTKEEWLKKRRSIIEKGEIVYFSQCSSDTNNTMQGLAPQSSVLY